jgi:hypothetical protein
MGLDGQTLITFSFADGTDHPLNLAAFPAGIYWLQLQHRDWTETVRLIRY